MTRSSANALAVARPAIQLLIVLNLLYAIVIAGLLVFSFSSRAGRNGRSVSTW